jgi:hypothetical protein
MNNKKITKKHQRFVSSTSNLDTSKNRFRDGIIYTLYSDKLNLLKVGFATNDKVLETKLSSNMFILLEKKKGTKKELSLMINTLKEIGVISSDNLYFKYSGALMRYLSILGWPVGRSLYKQRKIKKELICA